MKSIRDHIRRRRRLRIPARLIRVIAILVLAMGGNTTAAPATQGGDSASASRSVISQGISAEEDEMIVAFDRALFALSRSLLMWIGDRTGYTVETLIADPPTIVFALIGDRIEIDGAKLLVSASLHGAYVHAGEAIVLVLPWHIDNVDDRSVLLHELVHAVQLSAHDWICLDETEWEAYQLQRQWLAEHDIELQLDWILVGILSRCTDVSP